MPGPRGWRLWKHLMSFLCTAPSGASGKSWTQRTNFRSFGQTLCLQRCGTGWPPPSPSRPEPKAAEQRRSPSSAASCTLCRLGSSWNGEALPRSASLCLYSHPCSPATLVFQAPPVVLALHVHLVRSYSADLPTWASFYYFPLGCSGEHTPLWVPPIPLRSSTASR